MNNKKINVLMIPTGGMGIDGITSSIMNYYQYLDHSRIDITFVLTKIIGEEKFLSDINKKIIDNDDKIVILSRTKNIIRYFIRLLKLIKSNSFDVIHVHGSSSMMAVELLAAKIAGIPIRISHSHNTKSNLQFVNLLNNNFNALFNTG